MASDGRIRIIDYGNNIEVYKYDEHEYLSGYKDLKKIKQPKIVFKERMVDAILDIIYCIENLKDPKCTGYDGLLATEFVNGIHKSANNDSKVINFPITV